MEKTLDWRGSSTELFLNPRMPTSEKAELETRFERATKLEQFLPAHIWIATSGSSGPAKLVALSREAFLASAAAVNEALKLSGQDRWLQCLPRFHVGGLCIEARVFLADATLLCQNSWHCEEFHALLHDEKITICSLVPAQVFDLVAAERSAPTYLRAVLVGGAELSPTLYQRARSLGWPLLPSYGMTEACSTVASASLGSLASFEFPELQLLSHMHVRLNERSELALRSASLLSLYLNAEGHLIDPKKEGFYQTQDRVELSGPSDQRGMKVLGRSAHLFKIGGEWSDLGRLQRVADDLSLSQGFGSICVLAWPDARLGHVVALAAEKAVAPLPPGLLRAFEERIYPFERPQHLFYLKHLARSALGKFRHQELFELIRCENEIST